MGRSRAISTVLRIQTVGSRQGKVAHTPMEWRKEYGKPTVANIVKWVTAFESSTKPGGCNAHLGFDPVVECEIHHNGDLVANWKGTAFDTKTNDPAQEMAFSSDQRTLKKLIDGGRAIVSDNWMDEVSQTDYGSEIRTCRNRNRCGIHDAYVAWIHDSAKPTDLEFFPGYAVGSL